MRPGTFLQASGLVLTGFILGIVVAGLNAGSHRVSDVSQPAGVSNDGAYAREWRALAATDIWQVLASRSDNGRRIALAQNDQVRVVVQDDWSALYVLTYKAGEALWQGRLMDVGNDGTVEVADLSVGGCERFE